MFFNFGRFFGFGFQSKLDNLLKQENLILETILNEDDILSELKMSSSGKFADFIISHPNEYKKMIHYIIDDFQPKEEDIQQYIKFQFIISEVFSSENEKLINYLFDKPIDNPQEEVQNPLDDQQTESQPTQEQEDKESIRQHLLADFLQVLGNDTIDQLNCYQITQNSKEINYTLVVTTAGYVNKIIGAIIHRRGHDFWEYLIKNPQVITNLFKHAEQKHITEIIEKLIILDSNQEENDDKNYLKERSDLIIRCQKLLAVDSNSNINISNLCDILIELYKRALISLDTMPSLRAILQNVAQPQYFMNLAIQTQNTLVYNLLNIQFEYYIKVEQIEEGKYAVDLKNLYSSLISHLPQALTQQDLFKVAFQSSKGDQVFPLGDAKLELIAFIIQLCQRQEIADQFTKPTIFLNILDLIIKYPSNNQLSILFDKLVTSIIKTKNSQLQNLLFQDQAVLRFLITHNGSESRKKKPAFQGVLTKVTNYLNSNINESDELAKSINQIKDEWNTYIDELNEVNLKEQQWMCGVNPRMKEQENISNLSPFMPLPLIPYQQVIRKVESSDDNSITQEKQDFNEVEQEDNSINDNSNNDNSNNDNQNNDNQNNDNSNQDREQENVEIFSPNFADQQNNGDQINNQELPQTQEQQITEDITQEHDEQKEIKQNELKPEPEPTELIDQQQQPEQHLQQQEQENQQELSEPEPQQENQIQTQEPQAEPDAQQLVLKSNSQMQDEN